MDWLAERNEMDAIVAEYHKLVLRQNLHLWSAQIAERRAAALPFEKAAREFAEYQARPRCCWPRVRKEAELKRRGDSLIGLRKRSSLRLGHDAARDAAERAAAAAAAARALADRLRRIHVRLWQRNVGLYRRSMSADQAVLAMRGFHKRRTLRLWGGGAHATAVLGRLNEYLRRDSISHAFDRWHRRALSRKFSQWSAQSAFAGRLSRGFHAFRRYHAERTRVKHVPRSEVIRRKRLAAFARWTSIARHRRNMQDAKEHARELRRRRGVRGFRQLIARRVRALTPQQQARLLKLEKLRLLRIWRYRAEGSAMLSPARQHFVLARLEYALRKWDASVLHGKALKERRMGLAAVQHYRHRRLTRAFYRLFDVAERRGSCSASCAAYASAA